MKRRRRAHIKQRLKRLDFIKNELLNRLQCSIEKNSYIHYKTSYISYFINHKIKNKKMSISRHQIVCPINSSYKITFKKFRLSRFSLNQETKNNKISNLLKRGW